MIDQIILHMKQIKMKMKLNHSRPNDRQRSANNCTSVLWLTQNGLSSRLALLSIIQLMIITVNCVESPISQQHQHQIYNEVPHTGHVITSHNITSKQLERDVKDFHLMSDFRAVKLRWIYEHSEANKPAAFTVRFCELTSWNVEIKCRQRVLPVNFEPTTTTTTALNSRQQADSVISTTSRANPAIDSVHQLDSKHYETQIYDLRALTNYTFQVKVARFAHEPPVLLGGQMQQQSSNRSQAARRLAIGAGSAGSPATQTRQEIHGDSWPQVEDNPSRVETKPFGAEATKCLSDVSEVVVNTGRYFGGRISVENSADPRCNLLGNKSSEQTSYLFRIDHDICDSKVVDGNRIETMVLVHENKDILTHNTARFLVLCNFLQKSFTLRASISLPKVNGLIAQSRPAVITSLARKPEITNSSGSINEQQSTSVLLGSMPGIYRARSAYLTSDETLANEQQQQQRQVNNRQLVGEPTSAVESPRVSNGGAHANSNSTRALLVDELETNTIEKVGGKNGRLATTIPEQEQQLSESNSGKLTTTTTATSLLRRRNSNSFERENAAANRARSLTLSSPADLPGSAAAAGRLLIPQPVQVQSKVLFVERGAADMAKSGRQHHYNRLSATGVSAELQRQTAPNLAPASRLDTIEVLQNQVAQQSTSRPTTMQPTMQANLTQPTAPKQSTTEGRAATGSSAPAEYDDDDDLHSTSITMTNNHRISGDYPPINGASLNGATKPTLNDNNSISNYSIKYSALAKIDGYPIGGKASGDKLAQTEPPEGSFGVGQMSNLLMRVRSGRMRSVVGGEAAAAHRSASSYQSQSDRYHKKQPAAADPSPVVSRMGEMSAAADASNNGDLMIAETTNETTNLLDNKQQQQVGVASSNLNAHNTTLAQNITSYLLKWSLKTLTNLAKKSLETLIDHEPGRTNTGTIEVAADAGGQSGPFNGDAQLAPNGSGDNIEHELRSFSQQQPEQPNFVGNNRQQAMSAQAPPLPTELTSSIKKLDPIGALQAKPRAGFTSSWSPNDTARSASAIESAITKPEPSSPEPAKLANEELLDGFLTSSKRVDEKVGQAKARQRHLAAGDLSNQQQHHQTSRPSNYSKSLDFNKAEIMGQAKSKAANSDKGKLNAANQTRPNNKAGQLEHSSLSQSGSRDQPHEQPYWNESVRSANDGSSIFQSSWPICSIALFVALITGIFLTFWLVSAPNRNSSGVCVLEQHPHQINGNCAGTDGRAIADQTQIAFQNPSLPGCLVFNNGDATHNISNGSVSGGAGANHNGLSNNFSSSSSYQKYDYNKFDDNYSNEVINNHKVNLLPSVGVKISARPISAQSASTDSQSTRSTSIGSTLLAADENDCKNNEFLYTGHVLLNTGSSLGESYA